MFDESRHGIRHRVRDVDPRIAESDTGKRRSEHHAFASLIVRCVANRANEMHSDDPQRFGACNIAKRIGPLREWTPGG